MILNIWKAIGDFCVNVLFKPYDYFRDMNNSEHWWSSNLINTFFFVITAILAVYWFGQLIKFKKQQTED